MRIACWKWSASAAIVALVAAAATKTIDGADSSSTNPVGIVSNIKLLSNNVPNVSSLEDWKTSFHQGGNERQG